MRLFLKKVIASKKLARMTDHQYDTHLPSLIPPTLSLKLPFSEPMVSFADCLYEVH